MSEKPRYYQEDGQLIRVRRMFGKPHPLGAFIAIPENRLEMNFRTDNNGDRFLHSIGEHELRYTTVDGRTAASADYAAIEFKGERPIVDDYLGIIRIREKPYPFFVSEPWEIRGALRRLSYQRVDLDKWPTFLVNQKGFMEIANRSFNGNLYETLLYLLSRPEANAEHVTLSAYNTFVYLENQQNQSK